MQVFFVERRNNIPTGRICSICISSKHRRKSCLHTSTTEYNEERPHYAVLNDLTPWDYSSKYARAKPSIMGQTS